MLIHIISCTLLIIMLSLVQATAFKLNHLHGTALRLIALGTCIMCSSTYLFAIYSQSALDTHAEKIWSLPDEYVSDNEFKATMQSAKFNAKDRLELDITFEPKVNLPDYGLTPTKQLNLVFMSPTKADGFARAPMLAIGVLVWILTFVFGWMLNTAINRVPTQTDPSAS